MLQGKDKFALTLMNATQIMEIVFPIPYVSIAQVHLNVVSVSEDLLVIKKLDAQIGETNFYECSDLTKKVYLNCTMYIPNFF